MSSQSTETEHSNLGVYLRETRINQGLDLEKLADQTKISIKNIQAIEESDFTALPAEAFTRGFYVLYAKSLSLEPEEVLQMYTQERPNQHKSPNSPMLPPGKLAENVSDLAERPTFMPFSFLGMVLLLLLFLGGFLCWYFSWNPATYLSQKLRSLDAPQRVEQVSLNQASPGSWEPKVTFAKLKNPWPKHLDLFSISYPSTATAAITHEMPQPPAPLPPGISEYNINAEFSEATKVHLTIDDLPRQTLLFQKGDSITWHAKEKAVISLPAHTQTQLSLNNTPLNLPDTDKEFITLCLPEDLLQ
jgi:cytoskeletal protein RodZ